MPPPNAESNAVVRGASIVIVLPSIFEIVLSKYRSLSPGFHPKADMPPPKISVPSVVIHCLVEGRRITIVFIISLPEKSSSTLNFVAFTGTYASVIFTSPVPA